MMTPSTEGTSPQREQELSATSAVREHRRNRADTGAGGHSYHIYGMRICSEMRLLPADCEVLEHDVAISSGRVSDPPMTFEEGQNWWYASPDEISFGIRNVGRFLVRGGNEVRIQRAPEVDDARIRPYLVGSSIGYLLHQQRRLPLHASCVAMNGGCVAFVGRRGEGKSTLAAVLHRCGYPVITDDICATKVSADREPMVAPGNPMLKLKTGSLNAIGQDSQTLNRVAPHVDKYGYQPNQDSIFQPLPLKAVYILRTGKTLNIQDTTDVFAHSQLRQFTYRRWVLPEMGEAQSHFATCALLVSQIPIRILERPRDLARVDETLELLKRDVELLS